MRVLCTSCTRFHAGKEEATCDAFPGGIPISIQSGEVTHVFSYPGDNGLQYVRGKPAEE